jgi:membrane protein DedA with SNARE-associated domain
MASADHGVDRPRVVVGAVWGFAEALFFVIVPDVWVGYVGLFHTRGVRPVLIAAIAGALAGTTVLWALSQVAGSAVTDLLVALPGIDTGDLTQAQQEIESQGPVAIVLALFQGVPVKVHAHEAALLGLGLPALLVFVALNRLLRIGLVALAAALIGQRLGAWIARYRRPALAGYVAGCLLLYAAYFAAKGL